MQVEKQCWQYNTTPNKSDSSVLSGFKVPDSDEFFGIYLIESSQQGQLNIIISLYRWELGN